MCVREQKEFGQGLGLSRKFTPRFDAVHFPRTKTFSCPTYCTFRLLTYILLTIQHVSANNNSVFLENVDIKERIKYSISSSVVFHKSYTAEVKSCMINILY